MTRQMAPAVRAAVLLRDAYVCRNCLAGVLVEIHHRQGRAGDNLNRLSNLLTLCPPCHRFVTEHPDAAYKAGLSVRRTGLDQPDEVPYIDSYGLMWALTDDGQRIQLPIRGAA